MPSDIFIVRITPAAGAPGREFSLVRVSLLDRTRSKPNPQLKITESGYKEKPLEDKLAGPATAAELDSVAHALGHAILIHSENVLSHAAEHHGGKNPPKRKPKRLAKTK